MPIVIFRTYKVMNYIFWRRIETSQRRWVSHAKCVWMGLDGLRWPVHPHPKAYSFPFKSRSGGQS